MDRSLWRTGPSFSTSVLFQNKNGCRLAWPRHRMSLDLPPSLLLFTSPPEITLVFPNPMALIFALSLFSAQTVVGIRPAGALSTHLQRVGVSVPCVLLLAYVCLLHPLPRRPLPCAQNKVWFLKPSQALPPVAPHSAQTLPSALAPALLVCVCICVCVPVAARLWSHSPGTAPELDATDQVMFLRERVPSNREPHLPPAQSTGEQVRRPPGWARFGTEMETAPSSTLDDLESHHPHAGPPTDYHVLCILLAPRIRLVSILDCFASSHDCASTS